MIGSSRCRILLALAVAGCSACGGNVTGAGDAGAPRKMTLGEVVHWAYVIQDVDLPAVRDALANSHFDLYVLEPMVTAKGDESFDIAGLVSAIREHNIAERGVDPLILAYVDIGEAEDWRWYWSDGWGVGDPDWIAGGDPNGWAGNFPVAFWRGEWKDIVIYGSGGQSHVEATLAAGFDGIYMDWVEAFSDDRVGEIAAAEEVDPAVAMVEFIGEIRDYARSGSPNADPDYLVVAQNASDLYENDPQAYRSVVDAISCEAVWFDGDGGFDDWSDPRGYNVPTDDLYPGWTGEVVRDLDAIRADMPVFCVEYAQDLGGEARATEAYALAREHGYVPYCTRRPLSRLSTTPYPPGYEPLDYE